MSNPTIISNLEESASWIQPGSVGGNPPPPGETNGTFVMTPAVPCTFSAKGNYPWNNGYFYINLPGAWDAMTFFDYRLQFMLPTAADFAACQAVEFELQQVTEGAIFNMAWQADLKGSGKWRTFNYTTSTWEATAIPAIVKPGQWVSVIARYLRAPSTLTHLTLSLNGIESIVNITRSATLFTGSDYVHAAFQLDTLGSNPPPSYQCQVREISVTMQATAK